VNQKQVLDRTSIQSAIEKKMQELADKLLPKKKPAKPAPKMPVQPSRSNQNFFASRAQTISSIVKGNRGTSKEKNTPKSVVN